MIEVRHTEDGRIDFIMEGSGKEIMSDLLAIIRATYEGVATQSKSNADGFRYLLQMVLADDDFWNSKQTGVNVDVSALEALTELAKRKEETEEEESGE